MRKLAVITGAALALAGTWTAVAGQYDNNISTQPSANAYLSLDFGHPNPAQAVSAPLHYGLRMAYDQRHRAADGGALPALAQWDFDSRGNRIAMVGGVPFMAHIRPPMQQTDDPNQTNGQAPTGVGPEGLDFFDLTLLVTGVAGLGYLIYEVTDNSDSPDTSGTTGTTGGGTGGTGGGLLDGVGDLLGGGTTGTTGGTTTGGLLDGLLTHSARPAAVSAERDVERLRWLDGGNGHMGDLQPQR